MYSYLFERQFSYDALPIQYEIIIRKFPPYNFIVVRLLLLDR